MQTFLHAQDIAVDIALVDSAGNALQLTALQYRVIDQNEVELVAKGALGGFAAADAEAHVVVSAALNTLTGDVMRAMRTIELYASTDAGLIKITHEYLIEAETTLVEGINSFQSYSAAVVQSYDMVNLTGWANASKAQRIAALVTARRHIGTLRFRYIFDAYQNIIDNTVAVADLTLATVEQWNATPLEFRNAIRRAQIYEADFLLGGDVVGDVRRSGVMSSTVGESSQFFRTTKPLEKAVCKRAMKELAKYVNHRMRLTRA